MVLADTSVWIGYLRDADSQSARAMDDLLHNGEVAMVGMVLAEVLQGARTLSEFAALKEGLTALRFLHTDQETWTRVAVFIRELRKRDEPIPVTDLIIATIAIQHNEPVYAAADHFLRVPGLRLYQPESRDLKLTI